MCKTTLVKKAESHQQIERMKRMRMKQNPLNPLNPLTILGFFRGVVSRFTDRMMQALSDYP